MELTLIGKLAIWVLPVLFAVTLHEVAHGWMALVCGDSTAKKLGRLSLNPIRHVDPVGTVVVPGLLVLFNTGFLFGWAKPVPVEWRNLGNPKRDMIYVALAGPAANLAMGIFWVGVVKAGQLLHDLQSPLVVPMLAMGVAGIFINTILMVLNLFPLPPLDGGRVLTGLLPVPLAARFARIEPFGLIILVALLATGLLGQILWPVVSLVQALLAYAAGIPPELFMQIVYLLIK